MKKLSPLAEVNLLHRIAALKRLFDGDITVSETVTEGDKSTITITFIGV